MPKTITHFGQQYKGKSYPSWVIGKMGKFGHTLAMASGQYPNRIRYWRDKRSMTRPALASALNCSVGQVDKLERGERKLSQEWMERLAKAFGDLSPADFLPSATDDKIVTLMTLAKQLAPNEFDDVIRFARFKLSDRQ
jgi:transcriptional regulator with XRE-family HTH domain